jgi:hypothetical protein
MFVIAFAGLLLVERGLAALPRTWPASRPRMVLS